MLWNAWVLWSLLTAEPATARLTVLVLPLVAETIDPVVARTLDGVIASRFGERPDMKVVTLADLNDLVTVELLKDSVGCDDLSCSSELAGSIAADRIVAGNLGRLGAQYVLTLRWLDAVYAEPIAHASDAATSEDGLGALVPRVMARLFDEALPRDERTKRDKHAPSYWTLEASTGVGTRSGPEPYAPLTSLSVRGTWGGRDVATGLYYHAVLGLDGSHAQGSASSLSGRLAYNREQVAPFLELRAALPLAFRERTRLYASLGGALAVERHSARPAGAEPSDGTEVFGALRMAAGLWHRWSRPLSVFAGYRVMVTLTGAGADPISERYALGSSRATAYGHLVELGAAWHL